jgi:site-specific DNA recombinase
MKHSRLLDRPPGLSDELIAIRELDSKALKQRWRALYGGEPPVRISAALLFQAVAYRLQERARGGIKSATRRLLERVAEEREGRKKAPAPAIRARPGTVLIREWHGASHRVTVLADGALFRGKHYRSLSEVARQITGTRWSGPRFFGLRAPHGSTIMEHAKPMIRRCAIYTRKSSEEGLEQDFNSLHAQREACAAFIRSQASEGWRLVKTAYDDGGLSGASMERPALKRLLDHIRQGLIEVVVVYKVDRLTRSLTDFARMVELFDARQVSLVAVTQQFNTTTSMGRLTLNVLLSFAQFERELTGERIRDKISAAKRKGIWMGGVVPLGYDLRERRLIITRLKRKSSGRSSGAISSSAVCGCSRTSSTSAAWSPSFAARATEHDRGGTRSRAARSTQCSPTHFI